MSHYLKVEYCFLKNNNFNVINCQDQNLFNYGDIWSIDFRNLILNLRHPKKGNVTLNLGQGLMECMIVVLTRLECINSCVSDKIRTPHIN